MQVLTTTVPRGERVVTEPGSFMFMHPQMTTETECICCSDNCSRICGGESCIKVNLMAPDQDGYVGLTPAFPAKIIPVTFGKDVQASSALIAQGGAVMSQLGDVDVGCDLDCNMSTCCCAGYGCCRQRISKKQPNTQSAAVAFLAAGGTIVTKDLSDGETIIVNGSDILAQEDTVRIGVIPSGGCGMMFCGGQGCCLTTATGPGKVYMQSMSFNKFMGAVQQVVVEERTQQQDS